MSSVQPNFDDPSKYSILSGKSKAEYKVNEGAKTLQAYLALPVSEYSTNVLQAKTIKRLDESTFECELETTTIFGYTVTPIITTRVSNTDGIYFET